MSLESRIIKARGDQPAELVLRGGNVFDLVTGGFVDGDVAISDGMIIGIGDAYDGAHIVDVNGKILVPGFIDTHLHVESSAVSPFEFERCVGPLGVTTAICDPHEIANVIGIAGVRWFQQAALRMLIDLRVQIPSCVPSTHMETAGARLDAPGIAALRDHPSALGLAEFMNYPGVVAADVDVMAKLAVFEGGHIDGHAPLLSGKALNAYITAGIRTEHEATTAAEAREKLSKGMHILIREGSVSKDLDALAEILTEATSAYICLCTDDRNPLDIAEEGHIDHMIRTLIAKGVSPLAAYRAASLSAANAFGLKDRGLIAPGRRADIVVVDDLTTCRAEMVLANGRVLNEEAFSARGTLVPIGRGSVRAPEVTADSFKLQTNETATHVIGIIEGKIITPHLREEIDVVGGDQIPNPEHDLARISVIERHGKNGNIANGFVRGFHIKRGAMAATVCHDHHNICAVGVSYDDMALAVQRLSEIEGGYVVVENGAVKAELALPMAGLMSVASFEEVREQLVQLRAAAKALGITLHEPFLQLSFLALPVIPELKITDHGLVDVTKFEVIV